MAARDYVARSLALATRVPAPSSTRSPTAAAWLSLRPWLAPALGRLVKLLVWFLVRDGRPTGAAADQGVYTGLRRPNGERKLSWYAFRSL